MIDVAIQPRASSTDPTADPEEVDISEHFYEPSRPVRPQINIGKEQITDDQLRAMMLGNTIPQNGMRSVTRDPFTGLSSDVGGSDDIGVVLAQMLGALGGAPGEGLNAMPSFPGMPAQGVSGTPVSVGTASKAILWRLVHTVFALSLGLYIALASNFSGSKFDRELSVLTDGSEIFKNTKFFYVFAIVEVLLQSSRFLLEKGRTPHTGLLGLVLGISPEPYKGYLVLILRYSRIWTTVSADAMVCLFVLGTFCWMRGTI